MRTTKRHHPDRATPMEKRRASVRYPGRLGLSLLGAGALALGMGVAVAAPAGASAPTAGPTCGESLTASVTLTANLNCTSYTTGPALTIGANGVRINLAGHSVLGPGGSVDTAGIQDYGYAGFRVRNGGIKGFEYGLDVEGTSSTDLTGVEAHNLSIFAAGPQVYYGIYGYYLTGARFTGIKSSDAYEGIELYENTGSTVTGATVSNSEYGMSDYYGTTNTWTKNSVSNVSGGGEAITTDQTTSDTVSSNTVSGASADGIYDEYSTDTTFSSNKLDGVYDGGYEFEGSGNTWSGNSATADPYGFFNYDSSGSTAHSSTAYRGNVADGNQNGFYLDDPSSVRLFSNQANHNTNVGVYVYDNTSPSFATLNKNTANDNRYGLYAEYPASGSGNHATGNKVSNCHNVPCKPMTAGSSATSAATPAPAVPRPATPKVPSRGLRFPGSLSH